MPPPSFSAEFEELQNVGVNASITKWAVKGCVGEDNSYHTVFYEVEGGVCIVKETFANPDYVIVPWTPEDERVDVGVFVVWTGRSTSGWM